MVSNLSHKAGAQNNGSMVNTTTQPCWAGLSKDLRPRRYDNLINLQDALPEKCF